jgi:SGNH domain (fused to AT3 domains)
MATRRAMPLFAVAAAVAALGSTNVAVGVARLPKPGTESEVAALVAASSSIEKLPTKLVPPLAQAAMDTPGAYYGAAGRHCGGVTECVFGAMRSKRSIVLFGDSHAQMWLPALAPAAQSLGYRLSLVWTSGCPAATVSVWDAETHSVNKTCNAWRTKMVAQIQKLGPALVLLASRTSDIPGPDNRPTTNAEWTAGLEQTITELLSPTTTVAVVGDITVFSPNPLPECLAANPTSIQSCAVTNPNGKTRQHFAAERAAASDEGVAYIDPQPWLCTATCSPVIGHMVAYYDTFHVSATYAEYLSGVWADVIKPLLSS